MWTVAVILIILWMLAIGAGYTMGLFVHILYLAAVALLVIGLSQEVMINQKLRHVWRSRAQKPDSKQGDDPKLIPG